MRALLPVALVALALALPPTVSAQVVVWTRQFGSASVDYVQGTVSADASGVYVSGLTLGALPGQTSSGGYDVFVRKYDAAGTEVWTRQFGSAATDSANGISGGASGVYVTGATYGALPGQTSSGSIDAFVRKYDAAGTEVWTRQFGTNTEDSANGISVDASGVYVAGYTDAALPGQTYAGGHDTYVRKYDAAGTEVWTRQFGTGSHDIAHGISVDASGVYVAGFTEGALPGQTSSGSIDAFVRKYDAAGTEVWTRQFGSASNDIPSGFSVGASGVYVAGQTYGALPGQTFVGGFTDVFVRKYDAAGTEVWTRQFGSASDYDSAYGVSVDASGVYVAGLVTGALPGQTYAGGQDAFVRRYDAVGTEVWTLQFGTAANDGAQGIFVDASGVYVAGGTSGALPGQTSSGDSDAFVVKLTIDPLEASFNFDPSLGTEVIVGKPVTLTGTVSGGTGTYTISWDFGDGTGAKGNPVEHTYSAPGSRTVTLTVSDGVTTLMVTQTVIVWRCPDVDGDTDVDIDDLIGVFLNQFTSNLQYDLDADGDIDIDDLIFVFLNQFQVTC
jgi:hypothetical protein